LIAKDSEKRLADEAWMETKRQISWYRSQIRSMIAEAREVRTLEHFSIQAESNYEGIAISIRTYMDIKDLRTLLDAHKDLYDVLMNTLEGTSPALKEDQMSHEYTSKDEQIGAYIDNTNKTKYDKSYNSSSKSIKASEGSVADPRSSKPHKEAPVTLSKGEISDSKEQWRAAISEELGRISWKQVLNACSDRFKQQFPIHDRPLAWSDIVDAAAGMLPTLGISKSAWWEACSGLLADMGRLSVSW
jgi:replication initiation protein RepC